MNITDPVEHFSGIANASLAEANLDDSFPVKVTDEYRNAERAVQDSLSVAKSLEGKLAKLAEDKPFMTAEGYNLLRRQSISEAEDLASDAARRFTRAHEATESALLDSALPKLASDGREALARQELLTACGDATGPDASHRIIGIAKSGSAEAQAALGTPFARTLLISRQVEGIDRVLRDARKVVARTPGGSPEAQKATVGLDRLGKLGGAQGAALAAMRHSLPR